MDDSKAALMDIGVSAESVIGVDLEPPIIGLQRFVNQFKSGNSRFNELRSIIDNEVSVHQLNGTTFSHGLSTDSSLIFRDCRTGIVQAIGLYRMDLSGTLDLDLLPPTCITLCVDHNNFTAIKYSGTRPLNLGSLIMMNQKSLTYDTANQIRNDLCSKLEPPFAFQHNARDIPFNRSKRGI